LLGKGRKNLKVIAFGVFSRANRLAREARQRSLFALAAGKFVTHLQDRSLSNEFLGHHFVVVC
jgi:hypothetical protein